MQTGSLVMYTGQIDPIGQEALIFYGYPPLERNFEYVVTEVCKGRFRVSDDNPAMTTDTAVRIEGYDNVRFRHTLFTEVQGPGEVNIEELLEQPVMA